MNNIHFRYVITSMTDLFGEKLVEGRKLNCRIASFNWLWKKEAYIPFERWGWMGWTLPSLDIL